MALYWQNLRGFLSSDFLSSSDFSADGLLSLSVLAGAADPNENPDFVETVSEEVAVLGLAVADPNAKPVPVPNFTGSSEVLGVESAEPLPKTAPKSGFEEAAVVSFSFVEIAVTSYLI